jgi:hypothetical protein
MTNATLWKVKTAVTVESTRRQVKCEFQRGMEREREVMREVRLCQMCLDSPRDIAVARGY